MRELKKIMIVETKLFLREPGTWLVGVLLPTIVLVVLGLVLAPHTPDPALGGRFIDLFVPSLVVVTLATLGANALPARLVAYREKGVLRRLATTPVHPAMLLVVQLVINVAVAVVAVLLLMAVGNVLFDIPLPQQPLGFVAAFLAGMGSLFALGLLVATVAPTSRASAALIAPIYLGAMFLGGVYIPRVFLPDFLVRIGVYAPPGVQAMLDAWMGVAPDPIQLAILVAITIVAGAAATVLFRWE